MKPQILVAINSQDRLSQLMPYIEKIAQPGMKIIFLLRCSAQPALTAPLPQSIELNPNGGRGEEARSTLDWQSHFMVEERQATEHKVFLGLEALLNRGVEISVDVYTGSFRTAVKSYIRAGNVHMIIRRARGLSTMSQLLSKVVPNFASLTSSRFPPVRLQWTNEAVS